MFCDVLLDKKMKLQIQILIFINMHIQSTYIFKMIKQAILLFILTLALYTQETADIALSIIHVSQLPSQVKNPVTVSLRGGALIYIKAVGHQTMADKLQIFVGQFPCKIPADGVTETYVSCLTTDSGSTNDINNLPVTLISNGISVVSVSPNTVSYVNAKTSQLTYMIPTSNFGGQLQNFFGIHKLISLGDGRDMGDVTFLKLGSQLCSRFDIFQQAISNSSEAYIKCSASNDQQAGKYNVSQQLTTGFANENIYLRRSSLQVENAFDFTVLPTINSVTPNNGNQGGQLLTLKGSGFSPKIQNNTVSVDGTNCKVTSVEHNVLKCTLENKNQLVSSKLSTTSAAQQNGYFSGKGLAYARYTVGNIDLQTFVTNVRGGSAGVALQSGFRTQLNEGHSYGQTYGQVWKGYFTAPATGLYTFRGLADDKFSLYLATTQGSTELGADPLISSIYHHWDWKNFYYLDYVSAEGSVTLNAGKSYYLQAYHLNYAGTGFFRVQVDVPNTNAQLPNQQFQVHFLDTDSTVQQQIVYFNMTNSNPPVQGTIAKFNLKLVRQNSNGAISYNVNRTVDYGCDDYLFADALNGFDIYYDYKITVTREVYENGVLITNVVDVSLSNEVKYKVSIYKLRPTALQTQLQTFTYITKIPADFTGQLLQPNTVRQHSPLISGNFSLTIGGYSLNGGSIAYNIEAWRLQSYLRNNIVGYEKVQVQKYSLNGQGYKSRWIISYKGVNNAIPTITVSAAALSGGKSGTSPTVALTIRRAYSSHITFNPVDYRLLNTASSGPNVILTTNGLQSVCTGSCLYTFNDQFNITSTSIAGNILTLALSDPNNVLNVDSLIVTAQGQACVKNNGATLASYTCTVASDANSNPKLIAGTFVPLVYMNQLGFAGTGAAVTPINIPLVATSLQLTTGARNGGYFNNLTGSGFPDDATKISITICSKVAKIVDISITKIGFYMPDCDTTGLKAVTVTVGTVTNSNLNFDYTAITSAPTITSLNASSSNPAQKTILAITGTNFGTDSTNAKVFLSNATGKIYPLRIMSYTDTLIKVGLSGGLTGDYKVQISLPTTLGNSIASPSTANQFSYVNSITTISPTTGSYYGGTLLTITGTNFLLQKIDNFVSVGVVLNWACNIQTVTATQITCRTPQIHPFYGVADAHKVIVGSKLVVDSICPGNNCQFTYMAQATSPKLASSSATTVNAQNLTLAGVNFIDASNTGCKVVLRNILTDVRYQHTTLSCTATQAVFTVLNTVPSGNYQMRVRNQIGQTNALSIKVNWALGTADYSSGGSTQGGIVTFSGGSGYPTEIAAPFTITITGPKSDLPATIVSCCAANTVKFAVPPAQDGTLFTFNFIGALGAQTRTYLVSSTLTPAISLTSANPINAGLNTITVAKTTSASITVISINLVSKVNPTEIINVPSWTTSGSSYTFSVTLNAGAYIIKLLTQTGYAVSANTINVNIPVSTTGSPLISSFAGGLFTVTGANLSPSSYILVNGLRGDINTHTSSSVVYNAPPLITASSQAALKLTKSDLINSKFFTVDGDSSPSNSSAAFDRIVTTYYGSSNAACFIRINLNTNLEVTVDRVRFFPNINWANTAQKLLGATFEGSNNNVDWQIIGTIDQTVHSGWNVIKSKLSTPFKYIRFNHNQDSMCNIAQIQLYGIVSSTVTAVLSSQTVDVVYSDGFNTKTFTGAIQYRQDKTPIVQSVVPAYGDIFGGYNIQIKGQNLGFSNSAVVKIDGIPCVYVSSSATQLVCTVGARPNLPSANSFSVYINNAKAIIRNRFLYVLKWSDSRTWGVDLPPIQDDLVYVPAGMTLLVDQNTPILKGIVVQKGNLIFPNDTDVTVKTGFITLNGGQFIAGTQDAPLHSNLQFIMYGNYYGKQQPMFGNKGIGCINCKFSMYGKPRIPTWTTISTTISPGATSFTVSEDVDWQVGETIAVASTSFVHQQAEKKTISAISGRTITVNSPFEFKHVSVEQTYGAHKLQMRAEVGLLTRNIKMKGDDQTSVIGKYGSHLMIAGKGSDGAEGQIGYTEFTQCGQPQIVGRYCTHFHMTGQVPTSFVRGIAVHQSFARVVTLHGVYHLTVEKNVGYRVRGHNFFVQDGIETHNIIRYNLAISSIAVNNMMQTDTSVASFWITNPTNDVYGNHAAGSDFYGFWYEIKLNPDGPSATNDVCPRGNPLGYVANNVAHSNKRFGLRIFHLYARKYPCKRINNYGNEVDPWAQNPSISSTFYNFTIYKNQEDAVLAQDVGNVHFHNFTVAESVRSGFQYHISNYTKQMPSIYNSAIIGQTQNNLDTNVSRYADNAGIISQRSGQLNVTTVRFYNFPASSTILKTCAHCDNLQLFTTRGVQVFFKDITFTNVNGKYLFMIGVKKDVIYDTDGSFSQVFDGLTRTSGTIVRNYPHIAQYNQNKCPPATNSSLWDNTIMCNQDITIRRIFFTNLLDKNSFQLQDMKIIQINSADQVVASSLSSSLFTATNNKLWGKQPMKQSKHTWSLPYIVGKTYQVWWGSGIDFSHLSVGSSRFYTADLPAVIFKFNYTLNRQIFDIGPFKGGKLLTSGDYITPSLAHLAHSTCTNGQHYHNNAELLSSRMLTLCHSGKGKTLSQLTDVNGIFCRYRCPAPPGTFIKQAFTRRWSNVTQWPNERLPLPNQDVYVNGNWTIILDVDPSPAGKMTIDGDVIADDTRDVNITAKSIHIRAGNLTAGSPNTPFTHKFTIQITNDRTSPSYSIDELVGGNKFIVVTGSLNIYAKYPSTVRSTLTKSAFTGNTSIQVSESGQWMVGDTIGISPSYRTHTQFQKVTITGISADRKIITFTPALQFNHYGDSNQYSTAHGKIDLRAKIAHLNRNVTIATGPDYGWGTSLLVYGYIEPESLIRRVGSVNLIGVQIQDGGQYDTANSPVKFLNTVNGNYTSTIQGTSFVNCKAFCMNIQNAEKLKIINNVFYNGWIMGVQAKTIKNFQFTDNLLIGIVTRPVPIKQLIACFGTYDYINPATDNVKIKDNFCLGTALHGFALPHVACGELQTNPFANNTAGSTVNGAFIFTKASSFRCQAFSYAKAYASGKGNIMGTPGIDTLILSHFVMVDNARGVTVKFGDGQGNTNHTGFIRNSYIGTVSRPTCAYCYGSGAIPCNGIDAMLMLTVSGNGETLPSKFGGGFDTICRAESYENKVYMENVIFDNYRQTYSGALSSTCGSNFVFTQHPIAEDSIADHNLKNVQCRSCDANSFILAIQNNPADLGWFGGCGDILCTGRSNFVVNDFTGNFLGSPGTIIPNNRAIGDNEAGCVRSSIMNAHVCTNRLDFATLAFESIAADSNLRIMWPLNLTYDGSRYTNTINGWREWQWIGKEPQNKRKGRFLSIITLNKTYNISYLAMPPVKMQFQIQRRVVEGNNSNYIIVKMVYPLPNMIQISVNGVTKPPVLIQDSGLSRALNTNECGDNAYFFTNYTTHFVITQGHSCLVKLELIQTIQLTTKFSVDVSVFMDNTVRSSYISNLCALLSISDYSRVKIVGVRSGSAIIDLHILPNGDNSANTTNTTTTNTTNTTEPTLAQIASQLSNAVQSGTLGQQLTNGIGSLGNATLLSTNFVLLTLPTDQQSKQDKTNIGLIVGVAIAGVVILCLGVLGFCHLLRRRAKISEQIINSEQNMDHQDKQVNDNELVFQQSGEPQMINNNKANSQIKINQNKSRVVKVQPYA